MALSERSKYKKVSYTLSDESAENADRIARQFSANNVSLVVDMAIRMLARRPEDEIERELARARADRNAADSRIEWTRSFWHWMAREFGGTTDPLPNPFAPRTYGGYLIVFLLKSMNEYPQEHDDFYVHATPAQGFAYSQATKNWELPRNASPVDTAEAVAKWIRENQPPLNNGV